jgi:hypothetical protein
MEKSKTKPKALLSGYEFCTICYPIAVQHIGEPKYFYTTSGTSTQERQIYESCTM